MGFKPRSPDLVPGLLLPKQHWCAVLVTSGHKSFGWEKHGQKTRRGGLQPDFELNVPDLQQALDTPISNDCSEPEEPQRLTPNCMTFKKLLHIKCFTY